MSTVSAAFKAEFDSMVKAAYQSKGGVLRPYVRLKTGVVGSTATFYKRTKGKAQLRGAPSSDVTPMGIVSTPVTATLADYVAPEYTDIFDQAKISWDEKQALAFDVAAAEGRRADQMVIDALTAAANATVIDVNTGGANSGLNIAKIRAAKRLMDKKGIPAGERFFVHSAEGLEQMLGETAITSSDYNNVKALVAGEVDTFAGFKFIMLPDMDEGGIVKNTNTRDNFAFHGGKLGAVGMAEGITFRSEINYVPQKTSWLVNGIFSAGAVGIDSEGIYKIQSYE